ncbi:MAG: DUF5671 domain-containing protein [Candidatus Staskawiczbacteria bacterium]|nr:DUF5671 domain-containing protein [Candidatus Staskawiczbacteria bacterium]
MEKEIKRNIPRDLFLHLLAIVTLYWSAVSFVTLLWQHVNYYFPDVLNGYYGYASALTGPIRFAVSSLIIVFPVFILVSWYLNKIYAREAQVRESKIRKWLIYLTLFIASLVIIGDLISVINMLLGGEITTRFILKALSILLVAGFVFGYYLDDVRRETPTKSAKYFAWATGTLVLVAIISSFFIVGSPASARLMQFDQQKVNDLQNIQYQVVNYWQSKEKLPVALGDLDNKISGFVVPFDPQTNSPYEYIVKDATSLSFELCATFNKTSQGNAITQPYYPTPSGIDQNWSHATGKVCFERTIDKQFYPPFSKTK